jgi:hypothetical protein
MLIKIHRGTPLNDGEALCDTCAHARTIRGRRLEEEIVFCDAVPMQTIRITFKVTSCSNYLDDREPSYHELLEHAWILRPASRHRPAGFIRAGDLKGEEVMRYFRDPLGRDG